MAHPHPLPPPGPDHYAARRARWTTAPPDGQARPRHVHRTHERLQRLMSQPDPHSDAVWYRGVDQVWNGLVKGNRLRHPLPMALVIKVVHAAWRRDPETWPEGAVAPDSDESRAIPSTTSPGREDDPSGKPP